MTEVLISTYPKEPLQVGSACPAAIGAIISAKPKLSVVLTWSHQEFDRVWALALAGQLKCGYLCFTKPHHGKSLVVSASFASEPEE